MNEDGKLLLDHLVKIIDNLSGKFDTFVEKQLEINSKQLEINTQVKQQANEINDLKESDEKKFAERHPLIMEVIRYGIVIVCFCFIAKFLPDVAKLIGSV